MFYVQSLQQNLDKSYHNTERLVTVKNYVKQLSVETITWVVFEQVNQTDRWKIDDQLYPKFRAVDELRDQCLSYAD